MNTPSNDVSNDALPGADHLGQLLNRLAVDFQQRTLSKCRQRGHHRIRGSHFSIAGYLDATGQSLGELASRVGITQQATGKLLRDLEFGGYASSAADDRDKRSRIIKLTSAGIALQHDLIVILEEIRGEYSALLGANGLQSLERQLRGAVLALPPIDSDAAGTNETSADSEMPTKRPPTGDLSASL
jgi:MarR family transcriptional regulator, temperature-dependent positive regulator of motility